MQACNDTLEMKRNNIKYNTLSIYKLFELNIKQTIVTHSIKEKHINDMIKISKEYYDTYVKDMFELAFNQL